MAEPPLGSSTVIGLGPQGDGLLQGVSPETLRKLHDEEARRLRGDSLKFAAMTALCGGVWIASGVLHASAGMLFLAGSLTISPLLRAARSAREWWMVRQRDPIASSKADAAERARALEDAREQAERLAAHRPYATIGLAAAIIVIGVIEFVVVDSPAHAIAVAGLDKTRLAAGEWWRLVTSAFVHANGPHLWGNVVVLFAVGRLVEAYTTRSRLVIAYLAAIVAGGLTSWWLLPHVAAVGASGGILGLAGFLYALSRRRPEEVPAVYGSIAIAFIMLMGLVGAVGYRFIDNAAHAGGAVAGFLVGWLTVPRELPVLERSATRYSDDRLVSMIGMAAVVVLAAAAVFTGVKVYVLRPQPVTSVRAAISPRYSGGFSVTLENLKDVPLEAYTLEVYDSGLALFEQWRDEEGFEARTSESGPIAPHGFLVVPLGELKRPVRRPSVQVAAAMFADGSFEGSREQYDAIVARRLRAAEDADFLVAVIDQARALPPDEIVEFVDRKIAERTADNTAANQSTYAGDVSILLRADADRPERFATDAEPERARLVKLSADLRNSIR